MVHAANDPKKFDAPVGTDVAWCPGCGNFPILQTVKKALTSINVNENSLAFVSGIGQAAKFPQYIKCHYFNGLHGRALPVATGVKAANPELTVIVESGDGDIYGEGGNHFIHTVRRNPNITVIVHDNMIYGLTKGQAAPTSQKGLKTPAQPDGVYVEPINPIALAISLDASFVARTSAGDPAHAQKVIEAAINHEGFSLVDIFQPCIVFNKTNTYQWFNDHTYTFESTEHDARDRNMAFLRATEEDKFGMGIFYKKEKPTFEQNIGVYNDDARPLWQRDTDWQKIEALIAAKR